MKIAVVCANPWETFLPSGCQGNARFFYQWLCNRSQQFCLPSRQAKQVELYGTPPVSTPDTLFDKENKNLQIVYIESHRREGMESILNEADQIMVAMPKLLEECDKIYLQLLPWKEKCVFLWEDNGCREDGFFKKIQKEYKLEETQIEKLKGLSSIQWESS